MIDFARVTSYISSIGLILFTAVISAAKMSNTAERAKSDSHQHEHHHLMHPAKHDLTDKDIVEEVEKKPSQSSEPDKVQLIHPEVLL